MQVQLRAQVVVDSMGSFSPIANQSRGGRKPDSVVLMVGSCAEGLPPCEQADLLYSFSPLNKYDPLAFRYTVQVSDNERIRACAVNQFPIKLAVSFSRHCQCLLLISW